jgi:hypothetical protein
MKIKINGMGFLYLERIGEFRRTICPFDNEDALCGDWCALFTDEIDSVKAHITLCHREYDCLIEDFTDERVKNDKF